MSFDALMTLHQQFTHLSTGSTKTPISMEHKILALISEITRKIKDQTHLIIKHEKFSKLKVSWMSLHYMIHINGRVGHLNHSVVVRILSLSWEGLTKDLFRYSDFDQTNIHRLIYSSEFDMPGGTPYGLLIGDYDPDLKKNVDVRALEIFSDIASASFAPLIVGASPFSFGFDNFQELDRPFDISQAFDGPEFTDWNRLRESEAASFLGLALPKISLNEYFNNYLLNKKYWLTYPVQYWANACYGVAAVMIRSFLDTGWFLNSMGLSPSPEVNHDHGILPGLKAQPFGADVENEIFKPGAQFYVTDLQEQQLENLGFISVCSIKHTPHMAFHHLPLLKRVKIQRDGKKKSQALMAASLPYILCVSRFAHHLKIIGRNKIGSYVNASECESYLKNWLLNYVASNSNLSPVMKARFPLRDATVSVSAHKQLPGLLHCVIEICPHLRTAGSGISLVLKTLLLGHRQIQ